MGFCLLPRRTMARRGLIAALLRPSQTQTFPAPPLLLFSRSYSNKLFVGGLSFRTDEEAVRRAFAQHGTVVEVKLISDRESGRPKGFGFVTFESDAEAETARSKMTGQVLDGRVIRVDKATSSRPPLPSSSYGSGGGGFSGTSSSPISSSLPPVSEDWGTIPSNIVDIGAGPSPSTPTVPATNSTGFGTDLTKPFDSNTFGQAAASWPASTPASTPAPPSSTSVPPSSFSSSTFGSTTSFNSNTFGSATSFDSSTFGSAAPASSSGSGAAWSGSTPAPSSSMSASVSSTPASGSNLSNVGAQSSSFNSASFGSAAAAPAASRTNTSNSFDNTTFSAESFSSSTFGSASLNASTVGSASVSTNTSTVTASNTTVSSGSSSTASHGIPEAIIIESKATTATSTTSTISSNAPSGTADASKPLESAASTTTTPGSASAHPLNSPALTSSGTFDFSNFSFNSSSYRDNDPPLPRRRPRPRPRPASQSMSSDLNFNSSTSSFLETRSPFGSNNQFAETSIPKPKGTETDFGLLNITAPCPPGLRPQGVFDIYLPDDLPEIPLPEPKPKPKPMSLSMFPFRQLPPLDLPYHTPEADNWSEIGKDPPKYDLSTLFPSMGELIKKDKEFHWDPFDFDPEATLPPEEEVIVIDSDYDE